MSPCVRRLLWLSLAAVLAVPLTAQAATYYLLVGSRRHSFDHPPILRHAGAEFVTAQVIDALGVSPLRSAYQLPGNTLVVGGPAHGGLEASLNQQPLGSADVLDAGRARYLSLDVMQRLGFRLSYNPHHGVYQLAGRIHRFDYRGAEGTLHLEALTPVSVRASVDKEDRTAITLVIDGGWLEERKPQDFPADPQLARLAVKSQPELGRALVFLRQPERIGYALDSAAPNRARVRLGNFVALERSEKSSSGELGIVLKLGAPVEHRAQLAERPARLILDLPGAKLDAPLSRDATVGHATKLTLEPTADGARLSVDLTARADYRVLTADSGGKVILQLLPHAPAGDVKRLRARSAILLDPGHGGADPGAVGGGTTEQALNMQIAARLGAELRALGYPILETRTDDRFVSLGTRGDYANVVLPALYVSIHCNALGDASVQGAMTFIHEDASSSSRRAAELIQRELIAATGAVDKGVRTEDFFVTRETAMPSVLVECGFMSNTEECGRLCDPEYQASIAKGIARGIDLYITQ